MSSKIWLIARREYTYNFRRPMYLFTAFGLPLIIVVVMYLVFTVLIDSETNFAGFEQVGVVDLTPQQFLADVENPDPRFVSYPNEVLAQAALNDETIGAYFVIPADYLATGHIDLYSIDNAPTALDNEISDYLLEGLATMAPPNTSFERLKEPFDLENFRILSDDTVVSDPDELVGRFIVPLIFAMLLFITLSTTSQFLMSGVVEEKENRMMEILVTSCTPGQLLWGKVIGLGAISLTQVLAWGLGTIFIAFTRQEVGDFFDGAGVGLNDILFFIMIFILTYFVYAAIAIGVGAAVSAEQEARQFASVFSLTSVAPMIVIPAYFSPGNPLVIFLSLFPLTSPLSLLMGRAFGTLPGWVTPVGIAILVFSIFGAMWLAIRIFRLGMLMYGQRLRIRQIIGALRGGQQQIVSEQPREQP